MVKLKNPLLSLISSGKLADLTFRRFRNLSIAEKIPHIPDAKTPPQLSWRTMYQKAVALWHALSVAERAQWESLAREKHMTGFAWFISQALKPNPGLYLPLLGGIMQGNIDMATNVISALPDPVAGQDADTKAARDAAIAQSLYVQGARVYRATDQDIPHNTFTAVSFSDSVYDTDEMFTPSDQPSRLTCKTPGVYFISGSSYFYGLPSGSRFTRLWLNWTTIIAQLYTSKALSADDSNCISTCYPLAVGDFIQLLVFQNTGSTRTLVATPNYTPLLMAQRIG